MISKIFLILGILTISYASPGSSLAVQMAPDNNPPMDHSTMQMHAVSHPTTGQDEDATNVSVTAKLSTSAAPTAGQPVTITLNLSDPRQGSVIPADLLDIMHEKPLHLVGVRSDLNEFFHIHPVLGSESGTLIITHTFIKPGVYWLWSELSLDNRTYTIRHKPLTVAGEGATNERSVDIARNVLSGEYQVLIDPGNTISLNETNTLTFHVHTKDGKEVVLENYLGTSMHLSIIKEDGSQYIHAHPSEHTHQTSFIPTAQAGGEHGTTFSVMLHQKGLYRAFAQFRPQGTGLLADQAIVAPIWLEVTEQNRANNEKINVNIWKYITLGLIGLILVAGVARWYQPNSKH